MVNIFFYLFGLFKIFSFFDLITVDKRKWEIWLKVRCSNIKGSIHWIYLLRVEFSKWKHWKLFFFFVRVFIIVRWSYLLLLLLLLLLLILGMTSGSTSLILLLILLGNYLIDFNKTRWLASFRINRLRLFDFNYRL